MNVILGVLLALCTQLSQINGVATKELKQREPVFILIEGNRDPLPIYGSEFGYDLLKNDDAPVGKANPKPEKFQLFIETPAIGTINQLSSSKFQNDETDGLKVLDFYSVLGNIFPMNEKSRFHYDLMTENYDNQHDKSCKNKAELNEISKTIKKRSLFGDFLGAHNIGIKGGLNFKVNADSHRPKSFDFMHHALGHGKAKGASHHGNNKFKFQFNGNGKSFVPPSHHHHGFSDFETKDSNLRLNPRIISSSSSDSEAPTGKFYFTFGSTPAKNKQTEPELSYIQNSKTMDGIDSIFHTNHGILSSDSTNSASNSKGNLQISFGSPSAENNKQTEPELSYVTPQNSKETGGAHFNLHINHGIPSSDSTNSPIRAKGTKGKLRISFTSSASDENNKQTEPEPSFITLKTESKPDQYTDYEKDNNPSTAVNNSPIVSNVHNNQKSSVPNYDDGGNAEIPSSNENDNNNGANSFYRNQHQHYDNQNKDSNIDFKITVDGVRHSEIVSTESPDNVKQSNSLNEKIVTVKTQTETPEKASKGTNINFNISVKQISEPAKSDKSKQDDQNENINIKFDESEHQPSHDKTKSSELRVKQLEPASTHLTELNRDDEEITDEYPKDTNLNFSFKIKKTDEEPKSSYPKQTVHDGEEGNKTPSYKNHEENFNFRTNTSPDINQRHGSHPTNNHFFGFLPSQQNGNLQLSYQRSGSVDGPSKLNLNQPNRNDLTIPNSQHSKSNFNPLDGKSPVQIAPRYEMDPEQRETIGGRKMGVENNREQETPLPKNYAEIKTPQVNDNYPVKDNVDPHLPNSDAQNLPSELNIELSLPTQTVYEGQSDPNIPSASKQHATHSQHHIVEKLNKNLNPKHHAKPPESVIHNKNTHNNPSISLPHGSRVFNIQSERVVPNLKASPSRSKIYQEVSVHPAVHDYDISKPLLYQKNVSKKDKPCHIMIFVKDRKDDKNSNAFDELFRKAHSSDKATRVNLNPNSNTNLPDKEKINFDSSPKSNQDVIIVLPMEEIETTFGKLSHLHAPEHTISCKTCSNSDDIESIETKQIGIKDNIDLKQTALPKENNDENLMYIISKIKELSSELEPDNSNRETILNGPILQTNLNKKVDTKSNISPGVENDDEFKFPSNIFLQDRSDGEKGKVDTGKQNSEAFENYNFNNGKSGFVQDYSGAQNTEERNRQIDRLASAIDDSAEFLRGISLGSPKGQNTAATVFKNKVAQAIHESVGTSPESTHNSQEEYPGIFNLRGDQAASRINNMRSGMPLDFINDHFARGISFRDNSAAMNHKRNQLHPDSIQGYRNNVKDETKRNHFNLHSF